MTPLELTLLVFGSAMGLVIPITLMTVVIIWATHKWC